MPISSAMEGAIGSVYDSSFECDALKNRKINAVQTSSSVTGAKPFGWRGSLQRMPHALERHREPGQESDNQHRHEVVERTRTVLFGRQIALELLDDEKEIQELGVALIWTSTNHGAAMIRNRISPLPI